MTPAQIRKSALQAKLSAECGVEIEITVRSLKEFTLSAYGDSRKELERAREFLSLTGQIVGWVCEFDAECDMTFAYFTVTP